MDSSRSPEFIVISHCPAMSTPGNQNQNQNWKPRSRKANWFCGLPLAREQDIKQSLPAGLGLTARRIDPPSAGRRNRY
jgi:hypothetical protein